MSPEETKNSFLYELGNRQWDIPALRRLLEDILPKNNQINDYKLECDFPKIGHKTLLLNARQIRTARKYPMTCVGDILPSSGRR